MTARLLISVDPGLLRAVRADGGRADGYRCARRDGPSLVGNVWLGRVTRVVPALDAAFVACGLERDGFLAARDAPGSAGPLAGRCREGEALAVQAVADPAPGKGARLSAHPRLAGRYAIYRPDSPGVAVSRRVTGLAARDRLARAAARALEGRPGGAIVRAAALEVGDSELAADLDSLAAAADSIARAAAAASAPALLRREIGPVERLLRDFADAPLAAVAIDDGAVFRQAARYAERAAPDLAGRIERYAGRAPLFDAEGVADDVEALSETRVPLAGGGALSIERTEGMWTVDVDSADATARAAGRGALRLNLAAAEEVARQLRLRDMAGLVAVDFAGMAGAKDANAVVRALRAAAARDSAAVRVAPMSPFGVVELSRRRAAAPPAEMLAEPCPACGGSGRRKTAFAVACEVVRACLTEAAARPGRRLEVRAAPAVIEALEGPLRGAVEAACAAVWHADAGAAHDRFEVFAEGRR